MFHVVCTQEVKKLDLSIDPSLQIQQQLPSVRRFNNFQVYRQIAILH